MDPLASLVIVPNLVSNPFVFLPWFLGDFIWKLERIPILHSCSCPCFRSWWLWLILSPFPIKSARVEQFQKVDRSTIPSSGGFDCSIRFGGLYNEYIDILDPFGCLYPKHFLWPPPPGTLHLATCAISRSRKVPKGLDAPKPWGSCPGIRRISPHEKDETNGIDVRDLPSGEHTKSYWKWP